MFFRNNTNFTKSHHMDRIKYVENVVSDILQDKFEENEEENWPPNQVVVKIGLLLWVRISLRPLKKLTQHKRKKTLLPKFDHLETYWYSLLNKSHCTLKDFMAGLKPSWSGLSPGGIWTAFSGAVRLAIGVSQDLTNSVSRGHRVVVLCNSCNLTK